MPRSSSHTLRAAALFLILGFATALSLAYAAAIFSPIMPPSRGAQLELIEPAYNPDWAWLVNQHSTIGHTCMVFRRSSRSSHTLPGHPFREIPDALPSWSTLPSRGMKVDDHAYGLPFRCLRGVMHAGDDRTDFRVLKGWTANMGEIWLPRRFLWLALIANTLTLAAAWWLLLVAPGMSRRALRRRRGLCPTCAYDLRVTPAGSPCPECGSTSMHSRPAPVSVPPL